MIKLKHLLPECNECGRDWNHGHDHEAGMAKNELRDMISNASKIDSMVGEGDNLPGWVSAYISLAADYMHSVAEYLSGESSRMNKPGPGYGIEEDKKPTDKFIYAWISKFQERFGKLTPQEIEKFKQAIEADYEGYDIKKITMEDLVQIFDSSIGWSDDESGDLNEKKKPSAGLTKAQKSAVAKKAAAGKDIGKKGKGFEKVAKAAEKQYGSKEAGEKVAAAAMWKSIKRK